MGKAAANRNRINNAQSVYDYESFFEDAKDDYDDEDNSLHSRSGKSSSTQTDYDDGNVKIGEDENRAVRRVQIVLGLIVIVAAFLITAGVFMYSRAKEVIDFYHDYEVHANKIIDEVKTTTARSLGAIESLSHQLTIHAIDHNQQWPHIVLSDFETRAKSTIELADVLSIVLAPIVTDTHRQSYELFTQKHQYWLAESLAIQMREKSFGGNETVDQLIEVYRQDGGLNMPRSIFDYVDSHSIHGHYGHNHDNGSHDHRTLVTPFADDESTEADNHDSHLTPPNSGPYLPMWQFAPAFPVPSLVNLDLASVPTRREAIEGLLEEETPIVGKIFDFTKDTTDRASVLNLFLSHGTGAVSNYTGGPVSDLYVPVFDGINQDNNRMVGVLTSFIYWQTYFEQVLPENVHGMIVVLENSCHQTFTYQLDGPRATYLGEGDLHDPKYDTLEVSTGFGGVFLQSGIVHMHNASGDHDHNHNHDHGQCIVNIHLYPSDTMETHYLTDIPMFFAMILIAVFIFTSGVFLYYQHLINKRQNVVLDAAVKSTAVVQSLFPANVRERLFEDQPNQRKNDKNELLEHNIMHGGETTGTQNDGAAPGSIMTSESIFGSKPIADLFANTTVLFADMVGFTAWSSVREPTQVFMLLETVYHSFDMAAKSLHVFKVETVGDCYVAVAGLPNPRHDHALIMARFAFTIRSRMHTLVRELETTLGPDTADLGLRIGLHSGPVTAGVLRGNKGRFQLFGDTMNTASRIESTGVIGKIHLSQETADLLIQAGKSMWITPRDEKVVAKGKGELQTYWLSKASESAMTNSSVSSQADEATENHGVGQDDRGSKMDDEEEWKKTSTSTAEMSDELKPKEPVISAKTNRLIQWNVDVLSRLLKQIVARRAAGKAVRRLTNNSLEFLHMQIHKREGETVLDEVKDIIELPMFNADTFKKHIGNDSIALAPEVVEQLRDLVTKIASMYRENPFHNFEHASHVTMSVTKLLSRIVNPVEVNTKSGQDHEIAADLHDHTFGITSDPLTQFACVFSALIHDLDHPGVTNAVLVQEKLPMALKYKDKSVAEQNSVDLAWTLLMNPHYDALRCCIYESEDELRRFRQLVVNVVMATDIMDRDLGALRKARWEKAFSESVVDNDQEDVNRKATIVIEHLIQASDVAHTMQHWHVFKKWNERLFHEMYSAYKAGRYDKDPSKSWYKGEMGFFDFYIIPLAKKLETCGVFGVSSDEYLNYAQANRREWEDKGEKIVAQYLEAHKK